MPTQIEKHQKRCGNCKHWMTQQCPSEPKNKSKQNKAHGPNCNTFPCGKYEVSHLYEIKP